MALKEPISNRTSGKLALPIRTSIHGESPSMPRNKGLEELLENDLAGIRGLTQKAMFGGMAWLLNGNLLCGAREDGMLIRLGKNNDAWALKLPGVKRMEMQGRTLSGWLRAGEKAYADDALRTRLLTSALEFNRTLPRR
jgi:TfoX N-terminal domain